MPVDSCHFCLADAVERWKTIRDCIEGSQAVKNARETYLPRLGSHTSEAGAYEKYLHRSLYFNATNRTHDALLGFLFRKDPKIKLAPEPEDKGATTTAAPAIPEEVQANIDLCGNSIMDYAKMVGDDVASVGRCGTLIDWTTDEGIQRPRFAFYSAESIVNWRAQVKQGRVLVTLLVLKEIVEIDTGDEFCLEQRNQYRVFRLTADGVEVELHTATTPEPPGTKEKSEGNQQTFDVRKLGIMKRVGTPLMEIPFVFHNADHIGPDVGISPLYDLATVNMSHYMTSADLENASHVIGVPTVTGFGLGEKVTPDVLYLGGPAILSDNPDGRIEFLEFKGEGLSGLQDRLDKKTSQMAAIGARMIEPQPNDAEAFETVALRATAETSALAAIASFLSRSITQALRWFVWWDGNETSPEELLDIQFEINRDFVAGQMQPAQFTALTAARGQNAISQNVFFFNLERADMLPPGWTIEDETDALEVNPPIPPPIQQDPNKIDPATGKPFPKPEAKPPGKKKK